MSTSKNKRLIDAGRVEVRQGTVSSLPYSDALFDLVTAIESHYFWPNLVGDMKEVLRVLKSGGTLVMMGGEYRGGKYDERNERWIELGNMAYHSIEEFDQLFRRAGYTDVRVLEEADKGWMCGVGEKPWPAQPRAGHVDD